MLRLLPKIFMAAVIMVLSAAPFDAEAKKNKAPTSTQRKQVSSNSGISNPRYSGMVVEVDRQVVLYDKDSTELRHPASLTKAMTIYMAFDAIKAGKIHWNTMLYISPHAAAQPQTNIGLAAGDRISVQDLIESMIVHSANDSSVVLAEAIGGSEENFARIMTAKAHSLGMKDTVFKNANGLPNDKQVTTARDMVRMALALQKHFPSYYHMFKLTRFSYNGRNYESHNRVTRYYDGATGLKTGYIRASGFNLITTVSRDGYNLIGVVMGGKSSKSRDNHMVSLLDTAIDDLNSGNYNFANKQTSGSDVASFKKSGAPALYEKANASAASEGEPESATSQGAEDGDKTAAPVDALKETNVAMLTPPTQPAVTPAPADTARIWGIQVGTFSNAKDALMAATLAVNKAPQELQGGSVKMTKVSAGNMELNRAHVVNLAEEEARGACRKLLQQHESCFVFKTAAAQ